MTPLPIETVLPALCAALADRGQALLTAPPGAGKTTRVPLTLVEEPWLADKNILMLEPRRLAARAVFTAREFGVVQGLLAIPRVIVSNTVAIVAARRALFAYARSLRGVQIAWDKTEHTSHPAFAEAAPRDSAS